MADSSTTPFVLPITAVLVIIAGLWTYYSNSQKAAAGLKAQENAKPKKVLRPDEYQEFPLTEKTILSHNTSMYAVEHVPLGEPSD